MMKTRLFLSKDSLKLLFLVILLTIAVLVLYVFKDTISSQAADSYSYAISFTADESNNFRGVATARNMGYQDPNLVFKTPETSTPINNPYTGTAVFTIDSFLEGTRWQKLSETGFSFGSQATLDGTIASTRIKTGDIKDTTGQAKGKWSNHSILSGDTAVFSTAPTGRYATIEFNVTASKPDVNISFKELVLYTNMTQMTVCPAHPKIQIRDSYININDVIYCFGAGGLNPSTTVRNNLREVVFRDVPFTVHKAMIPRLLAAENAIEVCEKQTRTKYVIKEYIGFKPKVNTNNPSVPSSHSFGLAIDINASQNPNQVRCGQSNPPNPDDCEHNIPTCFHDAMESAGFGWGARFKNFCDAMHFQFGGIW